MYLCVFVKISQTCELFQANLRQLV